MPLIYALVVAETKDASFEYFAYQIIQGAPEKIAQSLPCN